MAHECPECGQMCYCGGDIDDCCFNFEEYVLNCSHCPDSDTEETEYDYLLTEDSCED